MQRDELIQRLQAQIREWELALSQVPPTLVAVEGVEGYYSVKDLVAHVMSNSRWSAAQIEALIRGTSATSMELYGQEKPPDLESIDFEHVNQWIYQRYRDTPFDQLREDFRTVWEGLLNSLQRASEELLDQNAPWPGGPPIRIVVQGIAEHAEEHLISLKSWRESAAVSP